MKQFLYSILALALIASAQAQLASDNAGNYGGAWSNGNNPGSGFLPWSITNNNNGATIFAGSFVGSSTAGAGNINTSGVSLGLYANPTAAFVNASRAFGVSLSSGSIFTFQLALNFDNGNKGFDLFAGSQGQIFNFNVGTGASVSSSSATLNPGAGAGYNYGGNDAVIGVTLSVLSATQVSYDISRTSSQGFQGTLFSGTVSGLTENISGFAFYVAGTGAGIDQNNLYINNLSVVPEPS
ncbi:MAG: hypothetical protein ACOYMS_11835, partial [Terrimicrobiaceae bacterium]